MQRLGPLLPSYETGRLRAFGWAGRARQAKRGMQYSTWLFIAGFQSA